MESRGKKKSSGLLAPGFRFHPTDEELVRYYLKRKVCGKAFQDAISEIDIYKFEPWDLPMLGMSRLQTRDKEWYFFSVLDKKYGNGSKTNRATEKGYWKITGKDRAVYHRTEIVGMKKTHVYHSGRAPKGQRTNWVMHEYMLVDIELERIGIQQDAFVLCRIFQKSGSGPKNGEQYGASFVEEEWEEYELEVVPKGEAVEEVDFGDDVYLDSDDLEQILGPDIQIDTIPLHLSIHSADASYGDKNTASCESEHYDHNKIHYNLSTSFDMSVKVVKHEYIGESSNSRNCEDVDYLLDEPFLDSSDNLKFGDGGFMEANDLSNPIVPDASYLTFFDANAQYFAYDPAVLQGSEDLVSDELLFPKKELDEGIEQITVQSGKFNDIIENDAAFPSDEQELAKYQSDIQYPSIKHASQMLGSMPAPPVFVAEYPSKDMVLCLNSAAQNSSHVTAGLIQIERNLNMTDWSSGKHENFNIILSFGFVQRVDGSASLESSFSILQGKTISRISRDWLYFMLLWILILSVSIKIGTSIYAN